MTLNLAGLFNSPAPVKNPLLPSFSRKHRRQLVKIRKQLARPRNPISVNKLLEEQDDDTLRRLITLCQTEFTLRNDHNTNPLTLSTISPDQQQLLWQLLADAEDGDDDSGAAQSHLLSAANVTESADEPSSSASSQHSPLTPEATPHSDSWLEKCNESRQELLPLLLFHFLKVANERQYQMRSVANTVQAADVQSPTLSKDIPRHPLPIDDDGDERPNQLEDEVSLKNTLSFYAFASIACIFWAAEGAAGGYALLSHLFELLHFTATVNPFTIAISIFFSAITLSMSAAVDLVFVSQSMGVNYLRAGKALRELVKELNLIVALQHELQNRLLLLSEKPDQDGATNPPNEIDTATLETCRALQALIDERSKKCLKDFEEFNTKYNACYQKRRLIHHIWVILAALLYAAGANLTATTVLGVASSFCPMLLAVTAVITILWISVELFRFYRFERNNIRTAVGGLFKTPRYEVSNARYLKVSMDRLDMENKQISKQLWDSSAKDKTIRQQQRELLEMKAIQPKLPQASRQRSASASFVKPSFASGG